MSNLDFNNKTEDELLKLILDLRKEQFNMRFQKSQGALENTSKIRDVRRSIARAKTFLSQVRKADTGLQSGKKVA